MKKYIFLLLALAFVACEKPGTLDGTVIDYITGDSIKGLKIGLYQFNQFEGLDEAKSPPKPSILLFFFVLASI